LRRSPRKRVVVDEARPGSSLEPEETLVKLSEIDILRQEINELKNDNIYLRNKVENLESKVKELQNNIYNYENISKDELLFKSETGLDTENFEILFNFLNPGENCINVKMYESKQADFLDSSPYVLQSPSEKGRPVKLNPKNQLFLYLSWLKGGFTLKHSSWLFGLPTSTVSRYLITWSNFMYFSLGSVPIWPTKETVEKMMPESFKTTYPATRCIIDCTELYCQRPSSLSSQSHMYSHYKSHVTYKGLIGITPSGAISFVSQLFEGSISDKEIVKRSGFLSKELWDENDAVMADRGFTIEEELKPLGVSLNIPSFLGQNDQLSAEEVTQSQTIASVRIHVERAI